MVGTRTNFLSIKFFCARFTILFCSFWLLGYFNGAIGFQSFVSINKIMFENPKSWWVHGGAPTTNNPTTTATTTTTSNTSPIAITITTRNAVDNSPVSGVTVEYSVEGRGRAAYHHHGLGRVTTGLDGTAVISQR